jgi:hypothetical protein
MLFGADEVSRCCCVCLLTRSLVLVCMRQGGWRKVTRCCNDLSELSAMDVAVTQSILLFTACFSDLS